METNEFEEMKAQLATLNEKLEGESIVDEMHFSEATKKHVSKLQRKLIGRIIIFGVLTPILSYFLGLYFGLWCLGIIALSIYVYRITRKTYSTSMTVAEYTQRIRKALKTYKKANKFIWILSILLILAFGTYVLIYVLVSHSSNLGQAIVVFIVCCFIALFMWVCYYISNVCVSPDVELMIEDVLIDLDKDKQCAP